MNNILGIELLISGAQIPTKSTKNAACYDCYLPKTYEPLMPGQVRIIPLGFKLDIPEGYKVMIYGRSGLASKGIVCHIGTVDGDYTGEIGAIITNLSGAIQPLNKGDRICQLALSKVEQFDFEESNVIKETERNPEGFGSSGGHSSLGGTNE